MPPLPPFAAETWAIRSNTPAMQLNGVYSGIVGGPISAAYDARSRTVQVFSVPCHHFNGFSNMSCMSFDDGATWTLSFNAGGDANLNVQAVAGWAMANPAIPNASIHFQVRIAFMHAFLLADGSMGPGGMELWGSSGGAGFFKLQDLATWPAINEIGGAAGAQALFTVPPSVTKPILLEGSGPDGEDAHWFLASHDISAGGAGNRTSFAGNSLWRSINGGITWEMVRDMTGVVNGPYAEIVESTTGRLFIVNTGAGGIHWTDGDLLTGTFTDSIFSGVPGIRGPLIEMYGGTFFTFSQGTLTGPGTGWISCDDGANFSGTSPIIPQNRGGFGVKLGPVEILVVAPGFADPTTETCAYYSNDGGETFIVSEPWLVSGTGELPVNVDIRPNGTPIVVCRGTSVYVSGDKARGVIGERTICPLANAGLAAARKLILCGGVLSNICDHH